jgi:hypothetical protein
MPQIRFALSRGFTVSGRIFDGLTRGGRAPRVALDPWLISCAHSGHSVGGSADRMKMFVHGLKRRMVGAIRKRCRASLATALHDASDESKHSWLRCGILKSPKLTAIQNPQSLHTSLLRGPDDFVQLGLEADGQGVGDNLFGQFAPPDGGLAGRHFFERRILLVWRERMDP